MSQSQKIHVNHPTHLRGQAQTLIQTQGSVRRLQGSRQSMAMTMKLGEKVARSAWTSKVANINH